jgi:GAF domain-containing protein
VGSVDPPVSLRLHRAITQTASLEETLSVIAEVASHAVDACDGSGITMGPLPEARTAAYYGDRALQLDQAQYDDGDGPCLSALRDHATVAVDVIGRCAAEWPGFARTADRVGVRSALSIPLAVDEQPFAAMNVYATAERAFTDEVQHFANLLAAEAALAIHNAKAYWRAHGLVANLERALETRDLIGQAKGILMAERRITADEAFELMRGLSQQRNVKVREIAEHLTTAGQLPD